MIINELKRYKRLLLLAHAVTRFSFAVKTARSSTVVYLLYRH